MKPPFTTNSTISSKKLQSITRHLYATIVGVAGGATVGMVGWGGAQIIIPSMTYPASFANYSQLAATGISLSSLSVSSLTSAYKFYNDQSVDLALALVIGLPAFISARVGSKFAKKLSGNALALFFNGFSIILVPTHFWIQQRRADSIYKTQDYCNGMGKGKDKNDNKKTSATNHTTASPHNYYEAMKNDQQYSNFTSKLKGKVTNDPIAFTQHTSMGLFAGIISSLMGVGGLPLTMSYLTEATDLPHHFVQGTAMCALAPSILMSAISRIHAIPLSTAVCVSLGAMGGGYGGAQFALDLSDEQLRYLYMGSLVLFGGRSVIGAFGNIRQIIRHNKIK